MEPVGTRRLVKLATRWSGDTGIQAVGLAKRADVGKLMASSSGVPGTGRLVAGGKLREAEGASLKLPEQMLLVLDAADTVHLLRMKGLVALTPHSDPLRSWPVADVEIRLHDGRGLFRALEIDDGTNALMTAALWRPEVQREAFRLIAAATSA
jgi:hypothetical protein